MRNICEPSLKSNTLLCCWSYGATIGNCHLIHVELQKRQILKNYTFLIRRKLKYYLCDMRCVGLSTPCQRCSDWLVLMGSQQLRLFFCFFFFNEIPGFVLYSASWINVAQEGRFGLKTDNTKKNERSATLLYFLQQAQNQRSASGPPIEDCWIMEASAHSKSI